MYAAFALAGFLFAAFASRIPELKTGLQLTAGALGTTLFAVSLGSVVGLPAAGWIVHRVGACRAVSAGLAAAVTGLTLAGAAVDLAGSRPLVVAALALAGLGIGVWDVAMNIEGAAVERGLGWAVMPRFHAAFSGGTVAGALAGAAASRGGIPIVAHWAASALVVSALGAWSVRRFLPAGESPGRRHRGAGTTEAARDARAASIPHGEQRPGAGVREAWREPRTLLVGVVTLAAAFTEGTANDWLSVAFVEGHGQPPWAGVLGLATFLAAMTLGRVAGTHVLARWGRVRAVRVTFLLAVAGAVVVVWGGPVLAYAGAALWGLGASLGFPVGMSAAADDPDRAAARVSVVSTIGYLAFLAGPPALGLLGDQVGVLRSLLLVGAMVALALLAVPAVREDAPEARG